MGKKYKEVYIGRVHMEKYTQKEHIWRNIYRKYIGKKQIRRKYI